MRTRFRASRRRPSAASRPSFAIALLQLRGRRGRCRLGRTSGRRRRCAGKNEWFWARCHFGRERAFVFRGVRAWLGARAAAPSQRWCLRARALLARRPGSSLRASARSSSWRGYDSGSLPSHCGVLGARWRTNMSAVSPALAAGRPSTTGCVAWRAKQDAPPPKMDLRLKNYQNLFAHLRPPCCRTNLPAHGAGFQAFWASGV